MSLLQRVSDMERIVESERGDVQTLAQECRTLRTEAVSAREECEKAQRLKGQLEALVVQLQEDAGEVCLMYLPSVSCCTQPPNSSPLYHCYSSCNAYNVDAMNIHTRKLKPLKQKHWQISCFARSKMLPKFLLEAWEISLFLLPMDSFERWTGIFSLCRNAKYCLICK